jgi:2-amino-4-hydroxy-6-hydroxymethyldihydropteridine diphosphokinase
VQAWISLGGNIGDVASTFRLALRQLRDAPGVQTVRSSSLYRSDSVGRDAGEPFLNAAATLETELTPLQLLDLFQQIELAHDRTRDTHWGPRTLDLDLILFGEQTIESARLTVPHSHCWYRRFVVEPLSEIAAEVQHPVLGWSFSQLRDWLAADEFPVLIHGPCRELDSPEKLARELETQFVGVALTRSTNDHPSANHQIAVSFSDDPDPLPAFWLRGDAKQPRQFLTNLLDAARGNIERIGPLE